MSKKDSIREDKIEVIGARVHNLKNVNVEIPHRSLTVITGLSGSGKSSLAFDTIYAEGQRRYMETLSAYARQFVGAMERPDVDKIRGLSPVVAIEQKTTNRNPRSTVGTVTEVNDFLRLLYARTAKAFSPNTGEEMVSYSDKQIEEMILQSYAGCKIAILAPLVRGRKGHYRELFSSMIKRGYLTARIDGKMQELEDGMRLDRYKTHHIELVIDRMRVDDGATERLPKSIAEAAKQGKGTIMVYSYEDESSKYYSRNMMCPTSGLAYNTPAPHTFSFNSLQGACPKCNGLGSEAIFDIDKMIPDKQKSIAGGAIEPLGKKRKGVTFTLLAALGARHGFTLDDPFETIGPEAAASIINGDSEPLRIEAKDLGLLGGSHYISWEGIEDYIQKSIEDESSAKGAKWKAQFIRHDRCSVCGGTRLNAEALSYRIAGQNIAQLCSMSIVELKDWIDKLQGKLSTKDWTIASEIVKEVSSRLSFLMDVGLDYLSLSRSSVTLSGGESQRIRLATQIGSRLVNVLYILDEPSIGLHHRDNSKLIESLISLRDVGNTVIVVEHDEEIMRRADWIIDVGPYAGNRGGEIVAIGKYDDIVNSNSITADYLSGRREIATPQTRRTPSGYISLKGARGNNLKGVDVELPLGVMLCVTGVSGSGKSSLINGTLRPILSKKLYNSMDEPLPYGSIEGDGVIDKMVVVDQSPIGRTPRSNPATYTGLFTDIRKLFEQTTDAKIRGFKAGRFSFNVKGGRCEECKGAGVQVIEMNFLPDVYVPCKACNGKRYNRQTLEVKFKGKSIDQVLDMTIEQALELFNSIPNIRQKLQTLVDVGLGYLSLGQPCTTLSGGESQRIKLAGELSKRDTGGTLYILDEPTTGLHFEDVKVLLAAIDLIVSRGNSVFIIEHNSDVIKCSDYIIDIGAEGGIAGGNVVATGTPEEIATVKGSYTGAMLQEILNK